MRVREQIRAITGHTIASINEVLDRYTKLTVDQAGAALQRQLDHEIGARTQRKNDSETFVGVFSMEQNKTAINADLLALTHDGAPGRTRTNTSVRKPDFESGASTNSATGAR